MEQAVTRGAPKARRVTGKSAIGRRQMADDTKRTDLVDRLVRGAAEADAGGSVSLADLKDEEIIAALRR